MQRLKKGLILGACAMLVSLPAVASAANNVSCELSFQMSGWSVFYKESSGSGTIKSCIPVRTALVRNCS